MTPAEIAASLSPADRYDYDERAAIMEFEAGLARPEAERLALAEVLSKSREGMRHLRQAELIDASRA